MGIKLWNEKVQFKKRKSTQTSSGECFKLQTRIRTLTKCIQISAAIETIDNQGTLSKVEILRDAVTDENETSEEVEGTIT